MHRLSQHYEQLNVFVKTSQEFKNNKYKKNNLQSLRKKYLKMGNIMAVQKSKLKHPSQIRYLAFHATAFPTHRLS